MLSFTELTTQRQLVLLDLCYPLLLFWRLFRNEIKKCFPFTKEYKSLETRVMMLGNGLLFFCWFYTHMFYYTYACTALSTH